jgi:hypothetical protein
MPDKRKESILGALRLILEVTGGKLISLVSDEEAGMSSRDVTTWLHAHHISLETITDQRHTALGVVDRLIRTLRYMNTPQANETEQAQKQSHHKKYRDFSIYRLKKFIYVGNHTKHDSTGYTTFQMDRDRKIEQKWMIKKVYETERRRKIVDFELHEGDMVRYIMPIEAGKKKRYTISPERYRIHGHEGHACIIMARDGSVKTVPRWRLKPSDDEKYRFAETVGTGNSGMVHKIWDLKKEMYQVKWKVPKGRPKQIAWEYPSTIRRVNNDLSEMTPEKESFLKGRTVGQQLGVNYTPQSIASLDGYLDDETVNALPIHDFDDSGNDAFMKANLADTILWHGYRE